MKYLCLVHLEEQRMEAISPTELAALDNESLDFDDEMRRSGHFVEGQALQPTRTATILRVRNGKVSTTDGPFIETKEQVGGFVLIEAKDLNEAIQVAAKIPVARYGAIEVRPVMELKRTDPS